MAQVQVAYTGICGTDLHIVHGAMDARVSLPAVLGHEMAGRVAAVGDGVEGWRSGDPVTVMPLVWCGSAPRAAPALRTSATASPSSGSTRPGRCSRAGRSRPTSLVALPEELSLRTAALAEPTAVAVHDVRRARLAAGEHAVVVGGGPIGLLIAAVARAPGAEVSSSSRAERRRADRRHRSG